MALDKKAVIWGLAGLAIGAIGMYLISTKTSLFKNATGDIPTLKKGAKGRDVLELQKNMNEFFNLGGAVPENGLFDKDTAKAVGTVFNGTHAYDPASGTLNRNFVDDFNVLINREKGQ